MSVDDENFVRAETDRMFAGLQYVYDIVGASTETTESNPAAIALVARGAGDPVRTALLCANLGGDTDTIGAIAVGVAGALSGYASIPADYIDTLNEVHELSLQPLAAQLLSFRQLRTERSGR